MVKTKTNFPGRETSRFHSIFSGKENQVTPSGDQDVQMSVHRDGVLSRWTACVNLHCGQGQKKVIIASKIMSNIKGFCRTRESQAHHPRPRGWQGARVILRQPRRDLVHEVCGHYGGEPGLLRHQRGAYPGLPSGWCPDHVTQGGPRSVILIPEVPEDIWIWLKEIRENIMPKNAK